MTFGRWLARRVKRDGLTPAEQRYVTEVGDETRGLPHRLRRVYVERVIDHLIERPRGVRYDILVEELGVPESYVADLRSTDGYGQRLSIRQRVGLRSSWVRLAQLAIVVGAVVALGQFRSYWTERPEIYNSCSGVQALEQTSQRAAGYTETRIAYAPSHRVGVLMCLSADLPIRVMSINDLEAGVRGLEPVGLEVVPPAELARGDAARFQQFELGGDPQRKWATVILWFETGACLGTGGDSFGYSAAPVRYHFRGRDHTETVPFMASLVELDYELGGYCTDEIQENELRDRTRFENRLMRHWRDEMDDIETNPGGPRNAWSIGHNLCRYLDGIDNPAPTMEPLERRALFFVEDSALAHAILDATLLDLCPQHEPRRVELELLIGGAVAS